jgi:putative ABC transport system ATP-binding protein
MPILQAVELYRFYHAAFDETQALRGVSLSIDPGEFVVVMGPSGSGKSTLLACLAGLDEPDGGHVVVAGERLTRRPEAVRAKLRARHIGMLLQSGNLFDHLTVGENIRLQMRMSGKADADRTSRLIDAMDLRGRGSAWPWQLSGGETARAGLAVALAGAPEILLADEPTAEVDAVTEQRMLDYLLSRRAEGGTTLVVTHNEALAGRADRVIPLRDGRIADG